MLRRQDLIRRRKKSGYCSIRKYKCEQNHRLLNVHRFISLRSSVYRYNLPSHLLRENLVPLMPFLDRVRSVIFMLLLPAFRKTDVGRLGVEFDTDLIKVRAMGTPS